MYRLTLGISLFAPYSRALRTRLLPTQTASLVTMNSRGRKHGARPSRRYPKQESSAALSTMPVAAPSSGLPIVDEDGTPFSTFQDKANLHPASKAALKQMGLVTMTEIQEKTFDPAAEGRDVLGRARTGTGKTVAFLLPTLERIVQNPGKGRISALILSPTRELAAQIGEQAGVLLPHHKSGFTHQVIFGGSNKNQDLRSFERKVPTILVATPGRLRDHLQTSTVKGIQFADLFHQMQILVLDEMDRLLDMGFRREVDDILSYLPKQRQTLLFSATIPSEVRSVIDKTMRPGYVTVDCIHDGDPSSHTNAQIDQSHVVVPDDSLVASTIQIILEAMAVADSKLVVFFPTAHMVGFYSNVFNNALNKSVVEIHSRKSQTQRTKASNKFREVSKGVLFTSDVSARGVDYPDVSQVIQVGMADSRESYIHRLGRTGRAGKNGEGLLVLAETEKGFLNKLQGLDLPVSQEYMGMAGSPSPPNIAKAVNTLKTLLGDEQDTRLVKSGNDAYRSMLGFYNGKLRQVGVRSTDRLVAFANSFAYQIGFDESPAIEHKTLRKMGLDGTPGLRVATETPHKRMPHRDHSNNPAARKKPNVDTERNVREATGRGRSDRPSGSRGPRNNNKQQSRRQN